MSREAKEMEIARIFKGFKGSADVTILLHALQSYGGSGSLAEQVAGLDSDEFDLFYADCMSNWAPTNGAQP